MSKNTIQIKKIDASKYKIGIVVTIFNKHLVDELYENTIKTLEKFKVKKANIKLLIVPGALEVPLAAKKLAISKKYQAIIALGVVVKGKTPHFEHVCQASSNGCMQVALETMIPVINGILTVNNEKQARERVSNKKLNKGREFAESAIQMANLKSN